MAKRMVSRRHMLSVGSAALASTLARPAIGQGRIKLIVQSYGGVYEQVLRQSVIPEFEKQHGYDVTLALDNDPTIMSKLVLARGRAPYDVVSVDNNTAVLADSLGLWAPDQSAKLSNIGEIYDSCKPPLSRNYAYVIYQYALVYNTDRFKKPSTWKDLWNDGVVVAVPHVGEAYGLTFLYIAALMNGGSATNLDPGFAAIKRLKRIKIFKNVSEGMSLFQQNEVDAGLFYDTRAQQMADMGLPIAKAFPPDGNWGQRTGTQIPKLSANMEGALAWINTSLSVPYQTAFAQKLYSPTNRDVVVSPDLAAKLIRSDARANAIQEIPWGPINSQRDAILDRWTREFGA